MASPDDPAIVSPSSSDGEVPSGRVGTLSVCLGTSPVRQSGYAGIAMIDHTHSPAFVIVTAQDISHRAHEIYVARGRADGFDRDDWLRAEHELKNPPSASRIFPRDATGR